MGPGPISGDLGHPNGGHRNTPILPSSSKPVSPSSHGDPMDITPTAATSMGPPVNSSPEIDPHHPLTNGGTGELAGAQGAAHGNALTAAAATSSQQPKMVNTAFIHKLYKYILPEHRTRPTLTMGQHAGGPDNTGAHSLVGGWRGLPHVPLGRVCESACVRCFLGRPGCRDMTDREQAIF